MKKIAFIFVLLLVFALAGCEKVPAYNLLGKDPVKGYMIEVNGTTYKSLPDTAWRPIDWEGMNLVALNKDDGLASDVYMFPADTRNIFVMEQAFRTGIGDVSFEPNYYYREDVNLPSCDRNGVNMLGFKKEGSFSHGVYTQNETLIDELFKLKNNSQVDQTAGFDSVFELQLMNSNYPGIGIKVKVYQKNSTYWICINESSDMLSPIPQELLEQIAGEKLPVASN